MQSAAGNVGGCHACEDRQARTTSSIVGQRAGLRAAKHNTNPWPRRSAQTQQPAVALLCVKGRAMQWACPARAGAICCLMLSPMPAVSGPVGPGTRGGAVD